MVYHLDVSTRMHSMLYTSLAGMPKGAKQLTAEVPLRILHLHFHSIQPQPNSLSIDGDVGLPWRSLLPTRQPWSP